MDDTQTKAKIIPLTSIPHHSTNIGIISPTKQFFDISQNGQFLIGFHNIKCPKYKVFKYDFKTHKSSFFNYKHFNPLNYVILNEGRNFVMCKGNHSNIILYDYQTGVIKNTFYLEPIEILFNIRGTIMCGQGIKSFFFINLDRSEAIETNKIKLYSLPVFMKLVPGESSNDTIYAGLHKSGYLFKLGFSRNFYEIGN